MKNTQNYVLKTSISMDSAAYEELLQQLFDENLEIEFSEEVGDTEIWIADKESGNKICETEISIKLAEYFGVKEVTNVHVSYGEVLIDYRE